MLSFPKRVKFPYKFLLCIVFVFWFNVSKGAELSSCRESFSNSTPFKSSLLRVLKPGDIKQIQLEPCGSNCLQLFSHTGLNFQLKIDEAISSPEVIVSEDSKILNIPSEEFLKSSASEDLLRYWLTGHELHPYSESSSGDILYKPAQQLALKAYEGSVKQGAGSFLHVAPTAVGKTLVLTKALFQRVKRPLARKVIIVV